MEPIVQHTKQQAEIPATTETASPMVERAFQLVDLLTVTDGGLALSELARALNMSKGSMYRLLKTLEQCGVVERYEDDRLYMLGPRIHKLAAYVRGTGLRRLALPAMQRLVTNIGETLFLGRVEQDSVHVLESLEVGDEHPYLHLCVPRGTCIPLIAGVMGQIVFASWPLEQRNAWLQKHPLPRFTEHSIVDANQFLSVVDQVASSGLSMDHGEYLAGINAVAVPITGFGQSLVAILCTLGIASHFDDEAMQRAGELLKAEAESLSRSLGG